MKIVDANIVLRYLLNDTEELSEKAADLLENNKFFVPNEVIAEIVYVLEKVYKVDNSEISGNWPSLCPLMGINGGTDALSSCPSQISFPMLGNLTSHTFIHTYVGDPFPH